MDDPAPAGTAPDPDDARLLRSVRRLVDRLAALPPERGDEPTPLGRHLSAVLGTDVRTLPVVTEDFAPHRLADVDLALSEPAGDGPGSLLDALDGLDGDADAAFVLTTNRVAVLERALAERPGRVGLAVEVPLPDADARPGPPEPC